MKGRRGAQVRSGEKRLETGKLPPAALRSLLVYRGAPDPRVVIGPRFGEDAAVIDLGGLVLVLKSDPVTFTADEIGWYAVHVNANDIAVMGVRPSWFQPTILLPVGSTVGAARRIMRDIHRAASTLGIAVTGGHTEVTPVVRHPVVAGDMQGVAQRRDVVTSAGARPGDCVVMVGAAGIEGTSILARSEARIARRLLGAAGQRAAARFHRRPGISVVRAALTAAAHGAQSMHDATEGGVAMGLHELAWASGVRMDIDVDAIPILAPTAALCAHFGLRPLGLLGSGALVLTMPPLRVRALQRALARLGTCAPVIGSVDRGRGVRARSGGRRVALHASARDELARFFGRAAEAG